MAWLNNSKLSYWAKGPRVSIEIHICGTTLIADSIFVFLEEMVKGTVGGC